MTGLQLEPIVGVRVILLTVVALVVVVMSVRLVIAWLKLSLGQKLYMLGSLCMLIYAGDAMREAIANGLEWRWRLVPGLVGAAALFGWVLEPMDLQRRFWGRPSFSSPPSRHRPPEPPE